MGPSDDERRGMSRREFLQPTGLTTMALGAGALGWKSTMAAAAQSPAEAAGAAGDGPPRQSPRHHVLQHRCSRAERPGRPQAAVGHRARAGRRQVPAWREGQLGRIDVRSMSVKTKVTRTKRDSADGAAL